MALLDETPFPDLEYLGAAARFIDDIYAIIDHIPLFGGFSRPEVEHLASYMECYGAPSGTALLSEGQEGGFLLLILTGSVDVVKKLPGEGDKLIATVRPGDTVGEMSLVDGRKRNATCVTREPTDVAVLKRSTLNDMLRKDPMLAARLLLVLLAEMTRRIRDSNERLLPHMKQWMV
jgi:CRP/FNR family transcriptional regulator, cyclic AMP receptor protein